MKTAISVCPSHCDATFVAKTAVWQEWEVDAFGECIQVRKDAVSIDIGDGRGWKCTKCGQYAISIDCSQIPVNEDGLHGNILIPEDFHGFIYWSNRNDAKIKSCPINGCITSIPSVDINGYTIFLANSVEAMNKTEYKDSVRLLSDEIPQLYLFIKNPRTECEGQISMLEPI